jgi:hypothetical protein
MAILLGGLYMLIGLVLMLLVIIATSVYQEIKAAKNTHAFLHDCYEQAYQMGAFNFDDQGCPIEVEHENKA